MRYIIGLLALGLLATFSIARTDDLEKKATDIVKKAGDVYKDAKAMHADVTIETTIGEGNDKKVNKIEATYDLERPNLLSLRTKHEGDKNAGIEITSDGKKLSIAAKRLKQYTQEEAPASMTDWSASWS